MIIVENTNQIGVEEHLWLMMLFHKFRLLGRFNICCWKIWKINWDNIVTYLAGWVIFEHLFYIYDIACMSMRVFNSRYLLCVWHVTWAWLNNIFKHATHRDVGRLLFSKLLEIMNLKDDAYVNESISMFYMEFYEEKYFLN